MHDIKAIRDDPEAFDRAWASRGLGAQTPELLRLDEQLRAAQTSLQAAQGRRNEASKLIGMAKAKKDEAGASAIMAEVEQLKGVIPVLTDLERSRTEALQTLVAALPNVPVDSWRLIFDPGFAAKLSKCGISTIDAPAGVVRLVLKYLGKNPNAPSPQDLSDAASVLMKIRPYIRNIGTSNYTEAMANGDICIALGYSGDFVQARKRAEEVKNGIKINYAIPQEGSLISFDMLAIPKDAPHVANAHAFINYLMNPSVIANITNFVGYANANSAATPLIDTSILSDTVVYPTRDQQARLFVQMQDSAEQARAITRLWQRFKTGQ